MNASTLPSLGTPSAPSLAVRTPFELVRSLSPEDKQDVFVELLKELAAQSNGSGLIPFEDAEGRFLGYFVPPAAAKELAARAWAEMPAAVREHLSKPVENLEKTITAEEMIAHLNRADGSTRP